MSVTLERISSNHMFAVGSILFVISFISFPYMRDFIFSLILAAIGLSLLLAAVIESIGERREISDKKGGSSLFVLVKILLNGVTLALLVFLLTILVYMSIMSGTKMLGILMVTYLVVAAWIIERRMKKHESA